jgi:hypothetical protein
MNHVAALAFSALTHTSLAWWTRHHYPSPTDLAVSEDRQIGLSWAMFCEHDQSMNWCSELSSGLYCRVTQKTALNIILAAVRTWNLTKHELFAVSWHLHRNRPTVARNSTYGSSNWILCVTLKMEAVHSIAKLVTTYNTTWSQTKSQTIHMRRCRKQTGILSGRLK